MFSKRLGRAAVLAALGIAVPFGCSVDHRKLQRGPSYAGFWSIAGAPDAGALNGGAGADVSDAGDGGAQAGEPAGTAGGASQGGGGGSAGSITSVAAMSQYSRATPTTVGSLHGPPGLVPQWSVANKELSPLTSSMTSISPTPGQLL